MRRYLALSLLIPTFATACGDEPPKQAATSVEPVEQHVSVYDEADLQQMRQDALVAATDFLRWYLPWERTRSTKTLREHGRELKRSLEEELAMSNGGARPPKSGRLVSVLIDDGESGHDEATEIAEDPQAFARVHVKYGQENAYFVVSLERDEKNKWKIAQVGS